MKMIKKYLYTLLAGIALFSSCEKDVYHADPLSLKNVKLLYHDADITLPESRVSGVVISDIENKNHLPGYIIIQNQLDGIAIEVSDADKYKLGDSVVINVSNKLLTRFQGLLQIRNVDVDKVIKISSNKKVKPQPVSITNLYNNLSRYENTLVQVLGDITPQPGSGETFSGEKTMQELSFTVTLNTAANASFANQLLPNNASFTGIALGKPNGVEIRIRNIADVENPSGRVYPGFPESFETTVGYNAGEFTVPLPSGLWKFNNAGLRNETTDRIVTGKNAIRFNLNNTTSCYGQMQFDVPNGASKVTLYYAIWGGDPGSTWRLEYSTDQGTTWKQTGEHITDATAVPKLKTFMLDINVPVRFRINKLGLGTSTSTISNGRLNIDDFAVYQPYR
jgi:hypothetical protein